MQILQNVLRKQRNVLTTLRLRFGKVWAKKKQKNTWLGSGKDHVLLCRHVSLSKPGSVATKRRDNILDSR